MNSGTRKYKYNAGNTHITHDYTRDSNNAIEFNLGIIVFNNVY